MADYPNVFKVRLNAKSIRNEISRLQEIQDALDRKVLEDLNELADYGFACLKENIKKFPMPYSDGDLLQSAYCYVVPETKTIRLGVGTDHALFVEFGTGVDGENGGKHPWHEDIGWAYNVGEHIHVLPDGILGWYYGGTPTHGMAGRHFFYDTVQDLIRKGAEMGLELRYK
jgi:hypothetical protein